MENKSYLASDLAAELGLPRSTINDWLSRYTDYLECENRGKRRFYSEKSLRILREISEARNSGASSFDIEQQLAARYGIRPEVAPHPAATASAAEGDAAAATGAGTVPAAGGEAAAPAESALPMARPAFDEMAARMTGEFGRIAEKLEEVERERRRVLHRMWLTLIAGFVGGALLLALAVAVFYLVCGRLAARQEEAAGAMGTLSGEVKSLAGEQENRLKAMTVTLDRSRGDFDAELKKLSSELAEQRRQFAVQLAELEKNAATRVEAERLRLKEEFAAAQRRELEKLTAAQSAKVTAAEARAQKSADDAAAAKELTDAQKREIERRGAELQQLRDRIAELEKLRQAVPVTPAPPAVPATPQNPAAGAQK